MSARFRLPFLRTLIVCLPLLALAACDSAEPDDERLGVTGRWAGTLVNTADTTQSYPLTLTLDDNISRVTGSGSIELPTETLAFTVTTGLFSFPQLSLELVFDRPPPGMISGTVSAERDFISGTLTGPGLANGEIELMLSLQRME